MANDYLNKVTDNVNLEIQNRPTSLAQAIKQVDLTGSSLEKARENEQKALERYEEGKISIMEVIEAQNYRQSLANKLRTSQSFGTKLLLPA